MASSKKIKTVSNQIKNKIHTMDIVIQALENEGYQVLDCRKDEEAVEGATKYTLFVRSDLADCRINFVSKPDKKSPFYKQIDDVLELGEKGLCTDEA